jgi:hypothetical protein
MLSAVPVVPVKMTARFSCDDALPEVVTVIFPSMEAEAPEVRHAELFA